MPRWYKYLQLTIDDTGRCTISGPTDPVTGDMDWKKASGYVGLAVLEILLRISVIVALGYVLYGGFRYITSQGEPDATKSARQTILNALIGMVIALLATGIVAFIAQEFIINQ